MYVSEDISGFVLGGSNEECKVYELLNNTYELISQTVIGEHVAEVIVDPLEEYLILETYQSIQTFYKCRDECKSCYFPNNCSACVEGYQLQAGKC